MVEGRRKVEGRGRQKGGGLEGEREVGGGRREGIELEGRRG